MASLIVFGDSYSDPGVHGWGLLGSCQNLSGDGNYPPEAQRLPMEKLRHEMKSSYPFPELGFVDGMCTNGKCWAVHLKDMVPDLRVYNFAHCSGPSCQAREAPVTVQAPTGYKGVPTDTAMGRACPRGAAQQLDLAASLMETGEMPADAFQTAKWVVIFIGANDFLFTWPERSEANPSAVGNTPDDAASSVLVHNYRALVSELKDRFGVSEERILLAGLPAMEMMPGLSASEELTAVAAQVDAINAELAKIGTRWHVAEWMRETMREETPTVVSYIYQALSTIHGPQDFPRNPPVALGDERWCDEYHPSAMMHELLARDFKSRYL